MRFRLICALALLAASCAPPLPPTQNPTPSQLAAFRARAAHDPAPEAQVALAAALRAAGQRDSARALLERVVERAPRDGAALLYLGLTCEELEDYTRAASAYHAYLGLGRSAPLRRAVQARLPLLERKQLLAEVRQALSTESQLSAVAAPEPRTVAVFPFAYTGADPQLQPLSRALASLLTTDLAQTSRLRVLERSEIQALLSEAKLSASGLVDSATAVRSGRLLRAGRIVQGQVAGNEQALRIAADVVRVGGPDQGQLAQVQAQDALSRLFDAEKTVALGLYRSMGIELTVAERERVTQHATENIQALLEFGWGLEAEDAGRYAEAAEHYRRALRLDSHFKAAAQHAVLVDALAQASGTSTTELAQLAAAELYPTVPRPPLLQDEFRSQAISTLGLDAIRVLLPDPIFRNSGSEVLGLEGVAAPATLIVLVHRP